MTDLTSTAARSGDYLRLVRTEFATAKKIPCPAGSLPEWERSKTELRQKLLAAWGGFPQGAEKPRVKTLATVQRDGYRVEKLLLETMPDVWMTALAYVPDKPGRNSQKKVAAVLNVHGHWAGAKQDPVVQSRCQGLAKLGFFVLAVDAFGAGDRAVGTKLGEYHGSLTAATLVPTGYCLSAIQVFENMRAVDYLQTRPEVDGEKIGVTGASGGGNQSMYVGAFDERIKCVVPVCSVGSYSVYLGVACCMCEVVPGAVRWTEEAGILSLTAPRALMVVNATRDAVQFSVKEATGSLRNVQPIYDLYQAGTKLKHAIFESGHDYSQPMREAMYGWMTLQLKGTGDGSPIPEPKLELEDREQLRCFPEGSRPEDFVTLPPSGRSAGTLLRRINRRQTRDRMRRGARRRKRF
ncbi:MAG: alpha/beta hydrolase family protein [Planctomycetales bacterium]